MANETKTLRFEFLADTKKFLGKVGAVGKKFDALGQDMSRVGGQINKVFAGIGVAAGAYSSIFIASPLLVSWYKRSNRE